MPDVTRVGDVQFFGLLSSGALRNPAMIRIRTIASYQDFSGVRSPGGGERSGADDFEFGEGLLRVLVNAAQDEEVGGDARIGRWNDAAILPVAAPRGQ
jgi:hypothetical protein